jgi:hypothetical protein
MSKRPETVHILGRNYSITYDLDNGDFGSCDTMENEIEVREGLPPMEERDTVLHEIMHGIWAVMDVGHTKVEEHVIRKMATGLALVFQHNPELVSYLGAKE